MRAKIGVFRGNGEMLHGHRLRCGLVPWTLTPSDAVEGQRIGFLSQAACCWPALRAPLLTTPDRLQPAPGPASPRCCAPSLQGSLPSGLLGEDTVHFNAIQMSRFLFFITPLLLAAIHQRHRLTLKGMLYPLCPFRRTFGSGLRSVDHTCATDV